MSAVIVDTETSRIVASFPTLRGAKIALARKWAKKFPNTELLAMEREAYDVGFRKMVETTSLMTGETVMIDVNSKGGCCDPGTETYWSM